MAHKESLFKHDFPEYTTNEALNQLKTENPHLDPYYIATHTITERRKLFEECYQIYAPYKDSNFLTEIPTRFHERSWEMYLGALFLTQGKALKEDRADNQADLQIVDKSNLIHVECTAVNHGIATNPDAVPRMRVVTDIHNLVVDEVPEEKILLRITQALDDKHKQYQKRLADKRVFENEPYIVAVNTGEIGHPDSLPRILKAVFGIGYPTLRMRQNDLRVANPPLFWSRREIVSKTNNIDIDMTFFEKEESAGISAVIYSNSNVLNCLMNRNASDIILVHNPLATNPIPVEEFDFLIQYHIDKETGNLIRIDPETKHG